MRHQEHPLKSGYHSIKSEVYMTAIKTRIRMDYDPQNDVINIGEMEGKKICACRKGEIAKRSNQNFIKRHDKNLVEQNYRC
jgi:hypothetical protein